MERRRLGLQGPRNDMVVSSPDFFFFDLLHSRLRVEDDGSLEMPMVQTKKKASTEPALLAKGSGKGPPTRQETVRQ